MCPTACARPSIHCENPTQLLTRHTRVPCPPFLPRGQYGYSDIGYHQNQKSSANPMGHPNTNAAAGLLPTPTLDALAADGVKLENYYVQPLW